MRRSLIAPGAMLSSVLARTIFEISDSLPNASALFNAIKYVAFEFNPVIVYESFVPEIDGKTSFSISVAAVHALTAFRLGASRISCLAAWPSLPLSPVAVQEILTQSFPASSTAKSIIGAGAAASNIGMRTTLDSGDALPRSSNDFTAT